MKLKDVRFSAFAKGDEVQLLATNRANPIMGFAIRVQGKLIKVMGQYVTDADALSVGSALILGYRSDISEEVTQAYVNTGAMHVLSVSGLHVGLVASLIGWLLGRRSGGGKYRKTTDALVQLVLVWGFALITGASSCVLRAAVMFGFMIVGKAFSRDTNIYNALLASAFFLLLYNPYFLFDVGFQLSYLGLLGILYFHPYIYKFGIERVAWFSEFYLINQIWNLTAVSFAAMLTTTPLSLYYFHQFPVHFWLSGLVVVPLSTLVLYLGLFLFAIFKWSLLGVWTGKLLQLLILFMNQSLHFIEQIPPGVLRDFWMESFEVVVWYLVLGMLAAALYRRQLYWLKSALIWSIFLALYGEMVNYRATNQHLLVVYDAGPELLMDFFEGRQIKSIGTDGLSEKQEKFTAANNRIAHRVASAPEKRVQLASDTTASKMYSLQGKNILLLMGEALPESIPLGTTIDLLVVYNCAGLNLEKLAAEIHIKKVVFTGKIRAKAMEQFAGECSRIGMEFHDTGSRGAFTLQL
jgi:competence protein ComEC